MERRRRGGDQVLKKQGLLSAPLDERRRVNVKSGLPQFLKETSSSRLLLLPPSSSLSRPGARLVPLEY